MTWAVSIILSGGTLDKNLSFLFVLSSDENAVFHFESVNARFDNLFGSPWLNVKVGKFELDNIVSEKRGLTLIGEWRWLPALSLHSGRRQQHRRADRR